MKYERIFPARCSIGEGFSTKFAVIETQEVIRAVNSIISRSATADDMKLVVLYVRSDVTDISLICDARLMISLRECLMHEPSLLYVKLVLKLLCSLWFRLPPTEDMSLPYMDRELIESVYDCLNHSDIVISFWALMTLANLAAMSRFVCDFLVNKEIFSFIQRLLLMRPSSIKLQLREIHEAALRIVVTIVANGVDDFLMNEMKQLIPFFQYQLLSSTFTGIATESCIALLPFLENDLGLAYAASLGIHQVISSCIGKFPLNNIYQYYLFRVVYIFVQHGYTRVFIQNLENLKLSTLHCETDADISPFFFALAGLTRKYWYFLVRQSFVDFALKINKETCFENKMGAACFLAHIMVDCCDEFKDRIANNGGLVLVCDMIECWREAELCVVFECILELLDMNFALYCGIVQEIVGIDTFERIVAESPMDSIAKGMGERIIEKLQRG
jgi:hypothetical protein